MIVGVVSLDTEEIRGVRRVTDDVGELLRVWDSGGYGVDSDIAEYLTEKDVLLSGSDILVVKLAGIESLSFMFGALRKMIAGMGPEHLLLLSTSDIEPLLAMGEPDERSAVESLIIERRLVTFVEAEDWLAYLRSIVGN